MTSFVPPELSGVWRREVITTPSGHRDADTQVLWLQTRSWYADIRVRADRPVRDGARGFEDYSDGELLELARVQGFAGQLSAHDGVCLWRRDIDYQPPSPEPDEATYSIARDVMVEDGIHSDYQEIWRREPRSDTPLVALRLVMDSTCQGREGLLAVAGDHFIDIRGRAATIPKGADLGAIIAAALKSGRRKDAIAALSLRISYGRIDTGAWTVATSSFPWLERRELWAGGAVHLEPDGRELTYEALDERQTWTLIDSSASAHTLDSLAEAWALKRR